MIIVLYSITLMTKTFSLTLRSSLFQVCCSINLLSPVFLTTFISLASFNNWEHFKVRHSFQRAVSRARVSCMLTHFHDCSFVLIAPICAFPQQQLIISKMRMFGGRWYGLLNLIRLPHLFITQHRGTVYWSIKMGTQSCTFGLSNCNIWNTEHRQREYRGCKEGATVGLSSFSPCYGKSINAQTRSNHTGIIP